MRKSPRTPKPYTSVQLVSSTPLEISVENVNSWDDAIRKAKRKIARLQSAIRVFQESKQNSEPWLGAKT